MSALLQTPGASRSILEAVVPYSETALADWLGGRPDQFCSEATARAMAMASFIRARRLAPDDDPRRLLGASLTASLATDRVKRGSLRLHLAIQSAERTQVRTLQLQGDDRAAQEVVARNLLLCELAASCGCGSQAKPLRESLPTGRCEELLAGDVETAQPPRTELLLGERRLAVVAPHSSVEHLADADSTKFPVVFPGAFNPPHEGHFQMAQCTERRLGRPLVWEISLANVDKPPLDFIALRTRIHALRTQDNDRPIALTAAATFREKAEIFPGATFVVGADTLARIAEPKYYGLSASRRDEAVAAIADRGCRFLAFGRRQDDRFLGVDELQLPPRLAALCDGVSESDFRSDLSSTEIRQGEASDDRD